MVLIHFNHSTLLYVGLTFGFSVVFVINISEKNAFMLLLSNIMSIVGIIIASIFQKHEFQYVSTFTWILGA